MNDKLRGQGAVTDLAGLDTGNLLLGRAEAGSSLATFGGKLDEIKVFPAELSERQIRDLWVSWQPATLGQAAAAQTTWTAALPANIEGFYQIDLTATDTLGARNNDRIDWGQWQGEIDLSAPRVRMSATYHYNNQTRLVGYAEDLNLSEDGLKMPCARDTWSNRAPVQRPRIA